MSVPLPFVGRDREMAQLRAALNSAMGGQGTVALISGEAGIGKTTLAEMLCQIAGDRGALALTGRCYDLTETAPYAPWIEIFEACSASDGLPPIPEHVARCDIGERAPTQPALFSAIQQFLADAAATRPLVLLLDDQHWVDDASLELLRYLARQASQLPTLLLVTYRQEDVGRDHQLARILPLLVREAGAMRLNLQRLTSDDVWAMVRPRYQLSAADEPRLVSYLHSRTEGIPFFVEELLRTLEEEGVLCENAGQWTLGDLGRVRTPILIEQIVDGRLGDISRADRQLLSIAAVLGQEVPYQRWCEVAETSITALYDLVDRAARARLMTELPDGSGARFMHALVRQVIYEQTPPSRRRIWHQHIGASFARERPPDPDSAANHFRRAGDRRAVEWLIKAADRAERAGSWHTATERLEAAAGMLGESPDDAVKLGWLLVRIARMRRYAAPEAALGSIGAAAQIAAAHDDRALAALTRWQAGLLHCLNGDIQYGLDQFEQGANAIAALAPDDLARFEEFDQYADVQIDAHQSRGGFAVWLCAAGRYREALAQAEPYLAEHSPPDQFRGTYGDAFIAHARAHAALGNLDAAHAAYDRARHAYRDDRTIIHQARTITQVLQVLVLTYDADNLPLRRRLVKEAEAAWKRGTGTLAGEFAGAMRLPLQVIEGQWDEARRTAQELRAEGTSTMRAEAAYWLRQVAHAQGDAALGWELVEEWLPAGPATQPGNSQFRTAQSMQRLAAHLALDAGDLSTARRWLDAGERWLDWSGALLGRAEQSIAWTSYHRAAGDIGAARERAEALLDIASSPRQPLALLAAYRLLGELNTVEERFADAATHLERALTLAEACAAPYDAALVKLALAELELARGNVDLARTRLHGARPVLETLDAAPALTRAANLARRLGVENAAQDTARTPVSKQDLALLDMLSPREIDVLRLLPEGLTNQAIAEQLFLSPKTIENHIGRILAKTNLPNRSAAAAFAQRLRLD